MGSLVDHLVRILSLSNLLNGFVVIISDYLA